MTYCNDVLKNGIRLVTHKMKERDSVSIGLLVGVGGRFENDKNKGAVHFLEHILFKGSQKYSCDQIKELIEGVGGTLNAFTAEEVTVFFAKIPSKHLNQTFDILADMVLHPNISTKDVNKERAVIQEEIKMYHDLPQYYVIELLDGLLWPGHPLGQNLAGSIETVGAMTAKDLRTFHDQSYTADNIVVSVCGNVDHPAMLKLLKTKMSKESPVCANTFLAVDHDQEAPQMAVQQRPIEQTHLAVGFHGFDENHQDRYVLSVLSILLGGNMSSRLFVEVREKRGLAYSISAASKSYRDTGVFMIRAGLDNQKLIEALKVILRELKKISNQQVDPDALKRAKDYIIGQLQLGLEDTMDHMLWLGENYLSKNRIETPDMVVKGIEKVTAEDLRRVAKFIFQKKKLNCALVGPITEKQKSDLGALLGIKK